MLFYDVPVEELVRRMISRGETSGRSDDNVAAAEKRIATFRESTMPLIHEWERTRELKVRASIPLGATASGRRSPASPATAP